MRSAVVRDAGPADFPRILELNEESVTALSALDAASLARLHGQAAYSRCLAVDGRVEAFLIALREGAGYGSVNYRWFAERYPRFLYVDRIVVARGRQRQGAGQQLYADLFGFAREAGVSLVTCEFDIEPPNEASRRFHERYGFARVGTQVLPCGTKRVALQALTLTRVEATTPPSESETP